MKLHNNNTDELIISSNDILVTGKNQKLLTEIINEQDDKLNNLERNVKWLYKYGGTGSKSSGGSGGSGSSSNISLSCDILFGNNTITKAVEKVILINSSNIIPLIITLKKRNSLNTYAVRITHNENAGKWQSLNGDNDYTINTNINITNINSAYIKIELRGSIQGGDETTDTYLFKYVTSPYNISLNILKEDNSIVLNNNDLYYNVANSNNIKLQINYNLETTNHINYEILESEMFDFVSGTINEDQKGSGIVDIPFNKSFLENKDNIGLQNITVLFNVPYDATIGVAAHVIRKELSFTYIPDEDTFFKIETVNPNEKIYKYNVNNYNNAILLYDDYALYYNAIIKINNGTFDLIDNQSEKVEIYNKLNISSSISEQELIVLINNKINEIENQICVLNPGTLSLNVQAYRGTITQGTIDIKCVMGVEDNLDLLNLNISSVQFRRKQLIMLPIYEEGVYKMSIYSDTIEPEDRIYYYFCVFNKNNMINWYSTDVSNNKYLSCYYRAGEVTNEPSIQKFKNSVYIQQYSSSPQSQLLSLSDINTVTSKEDILLSFGIQYSEINNTDNKILSVLCNNSENSTIDLDIYQNKIIMGDKIVNIYIPKESDYNPSTKSNYHLLNIYKRYIYSKNNNYYEICVYLDGSLEGAFENFTNDSSGWDTVIMNPANYSLNLFELSYFAHNNSLVNGEEIFNRKRFDENGNRQAITYLDDIAISEYFYKYENSILQNIENDPSYEDAQMIFNELQLFKETENGMIEVQNENVIKKIAENINIPILMFNYPENSDYDFISRFTHSYTEGFGENSTFILDRTSPLYYSSGKRELQLISLPSELSGAYWYIQLQGSSTGLFFGKNLTLGINPGTNKGYMPIFTPNFMYLSTEEFNKSNPTEEESNKIKKARDSFLPETAFTLKADCVDSSHSNNTAIGKFVNENTTPFDIKFNEGNTNINKENCTYVNYIKNCLLGFGCLVFVQVQNKEKTSSKYYFLGIYNFNLGRDSYFNMGYYSPSSLMNDRKCNEDLMSLKTGNDFKVTYITLDEDSSSLPVSNGVIVAEIQGGNPRYDFSQYNNTILLPQSNSDKGAMFGDFVPNYDPTSSVGTSARIKYHLPRLVKAISDAGGYLFEYVLHKHLGEYNWGYSRYIDNGRSSSIFESANQVPNYRVQYIRNINANVSAENYYDIVKVNGSPYISNKEMTVEDVYRLISVESEEGETMPYGRPEPILDYTSVSEYYTTCMAFGLVDSVMKNLNVKTWDSTYVDGSDDSVNNTGKWFTAFYDMDTAFGRNNAGTKTSYFAFSDYWKTPNSTSLSPATIYRDFYPASDASNPNVADQKVTDAGFDIPSSYLFAVAKYAPLLGVSNFGSIFETSTPQNIWARWRYTGVSNSDTNGPGRSELRNANYFIDKYFIRNLNEIPEQLWTLNYRFKYLKRIIKNDGSNVYVTDDVSGVFESKNYRAFHGKGIHELREWLSGRFHILDAYFNLDGSNVPIKYLAYEINDTEQPANIIEPINENGNIIAYKYIDNLKPSKDTDGIAFKWSSISAGLTNLFDTVPKIDANALTPNNDIYILQDIFTQGGFGQQYDSEINLIVKAQEYSPLIIGYAQGMTEKFLLNNPSVKYSINLKNTGLQQFKFGGSLLWTYIENYNDIIINKQITVNSPRLDSFTLTKGICGTYNINQMKSLKYIHIEKDKQDENTSFTGTLQINKDGNGKEIFPDLTTINLIRTNIRLLVDGSSVQTINLSYTTTESDVQILNCNNLNNVTLNYFKCNRLDIAPGWSNNISLMNTSINTLNLSSKNKNDEIRTFAIDNDSSLETLILEGFTHITIRNCVNLNNICIKDPQNVKKLNIEYCSKNDQLLFIHSNVNETYEDFLGSLNKNIVNLNEFINIEEFKFTGTGGFNTIDISEIDGKQYFTNNNTYNIISLHTSAFAETKVERIITKPNVYLYIDSDNVNGTTATFNNSCYGQPQYINNMIIGSNVRSLDNMFACNISSTQSTSKAYITRDFVSVFLQNSTSTSYNIIFENIDNITSMRSLFYGQSQITANINQSNLISLCNFHNVNDISYIFYGTAISSLDEKMFGVENNYVGMNVINTGQIIKINCCIPTICSIAETFFDFVINNIDNLISDNPAYIKYNFKIINNNSELTEFNIANIFSKLNESNKLKSIRGFNINDSIKVNYDSLLYDFINDVKKFPLLTTIEYSFNNYNKEDINVNYIGLNKYYNVELANSFNFSTELTEKFNINKFIDFNNLNNYSNFVLYTTCESLSGAKEINESNIISILESLNSIGCKDISRLFDHTSVYVNVDNEDPYNYELTLSRNNTIYAFTNCSYLFADSKLINNSLAEEFGYTITSNSLSAFKNVANWSHSFENCKLHKNLPLNMFNQMYDATIDKPYVISNYRYTVINDLSYMFNNVKFDGKPGSKSWFEYDWETKDPTYSYNNGVELNGSYHKEIKTLVKLTLNNPLSYDKTLINHEYTYGLNIVKNLILPWDIFYGCSANTNIDNFISNSDFEGILPTLLFTERLNKIRIKNVFTETLVIPNYVGTYLISTKSAYNNPAESYAMCPSYVFVPSNFTANETLNESFKFKIIMPNSEHKIIVGNDYLENNNNELELYFIFKNDSFNKSTLRMMQNSLPIMTTQTVDGSNRNLYIINEALNDGIDFTKQFNSRIDYGMHYYINLYNFTNDTEPNGINKIDNTDINSNFITIDNEKTGLSFGQIHDSLIYNMFNGDIMGLLYGSILDGLIDLLNIPSNTGFNVPLCKFNDYVIGCTLSYNIILPLNGNSYGGYNLAFDTPKFTINISKKNIYHKDETSLRNYVKINENKFKLESTDPNTGLSY